MNHKKITRLRKGSALIGVFMIAMMIAVIAVSYLKLVQQEVQYSGRSMHFNSALNMAESGIDEAMWALNNENLDDWEINVFNAWRKVSGFDLGGGAEGSFRVIIQDMNTTPVIYSEGIVTFGNEEVLTKQVKIKLSSRKKFPMALTAKDSITFSGGNSNIDSFKCGEPLSRRYDNGSIGAISAETDAVSISNASIYGFVATGGGSPSLGPNGKVYGSDRKDEVELYGNRDMFVDESRIATDFSTDLDDVTIPSGAGSTLPSGSHITIGDASGVSETRYDMSSLTLQSSKSITVEGPVTMVISGDATIKGTVSLVGPNASLTVYVEGNLTVSGNGIVNPSSDPLYPPTPEKLIVYGSADSDTGQTIKLAGNAALAGAVYAPNAAIELKGGGSSGVMYGAAVGDTIKITGNYDVHYDECLNDFFAGDTSWQMYEWTELLTPEEQFDMVSYFEID